MLSLSRTKIYFDSLHLFHMYFPSFYSKYNFVSSTFSAPLLTIINNQFRLSISVRLLLPYLYLTCLYKLPSFTVMTVAPVFFLPFPYAFVRLLFLLKICLSVSSGALSFFYPCTSLLSYFFYYVKKFVFLNIVCFSVWLSVSFSPCISPLSHVLFYSCLSVFLSYLLSFFLCYTFFSSFFLSLFFLSLFLFLSFFLSFFLSCFLSVCLSVFLSIFIHLTPVLLLTLMHQSYETIWVPGKCTSE